MSGSGLRLRTGGGRLGLDEGMGEGLSVGEERLGASLRGGGVTWGLRWWVWEGGRREERREGGGEEIG